MIKKEDAVLTKQDLISHLIQKLHYTHRDAFAHVDGFINSLQIFWLKGITLK